MILSDTVILCHPHVVLSCVHCSHFPPTANISKEPAGQSYSRKIAFLHSVDFFPKFLGVITFDIKPFCAVFPSSCLISCVRYSWGKGKQLQCCVVLSYSQAQHQVLLLFDLQDSPLDIAAWVCWTQPQVYCSERVQWQSTPKDWYHCCQVLAAGCRPIQLSPICRVLPVFYSLHNGPCKNESPLVPRASTKCVNN